MSTVATDDVRERQLTTERPFWGEITACRMVEREDGRFVTYLEVTWLPRERMLILNKSPKDQPRPKVWANATLALRYIRDVLWYHGPVMFLVCAERPSVAEPSWVRAHHEAASRSEIDG